MSNKKLWFRAKNYGWGWYPITWQGWLTVAIFTLYIVYRANAVSAMFDTNSSAVFRFFFELIIPITLLLAICYFKGEKPGWRWGKKKTPPRQGLKKN